MNSMEKSFAGNFTRSDVTIEFIKRYAVGVLPDYYQLNGDRLEIQIRDMVERLAKEVVLCGNLPAEPLEKFTATAHWVVPKSWWQMFKRDVLPTWFSGKYPVIEKPQSKQVEVKCYAVYPRLPVAFPKYGEVKFAYTESFSN